MKITSSERAAGAETTPLLALLCIEGVAPELPSGLSLPARVLADFRGKLRQTVVAYPEGRSRVERVALVGLGPKGKLGAEELRRGAAIAWAAARDRSATKLSIALAADLPKALDPGVVGRSLAEGVVLASYRNLRFKGAEARKASAKQKSPERAVLHGKGSDFVHGVERGARVAEAVNFARDLEDSPANFATPRVLAAAANKLAGRRVTCRVLEEKDMKRLGMGALLGVSQGSSEPAKLIVLRYRPKGRVRERIAVVGKGLTFDSGGISIKPSAAMDEMKYDMCGGGAVLGLFHALREMDLPLEVIGVVPASENLPDGKAYKPSDVLQAMNGTTIEVLNTDAEGRLILCDAICYVEKEFEPDVIVDLATLTGAVVVALGHEATGVLGNDDATRDAVCDAGERAGERCWPLPLWDVHRDQMKSDLADLKNINSGKDGGGAIAGGAFLAHFVKKAKWVHMDIAGTAWGGRERDYLHSSGANGVGVRTLVQFLLDRAARR